MQSSMMEKDTVQDLYDEIEHLIDVPFEKFSSPKEPKDFHYKEYHREDEYYFESEQQQREEDIPQQHNSNDSNNNDQMVPNSANKDYSFERPILIESDSDDIEEELAITPNQYALPVCFKCDRPIAHQSTLNVTQPNNICDECSKKKRSRSGSFTFTQLADKLKQSFGHSSSSGSSSHQLLSPAGVKNVDRRKSMPSMNSVFDHDQQQALSPPSPVPSRPSSRASSFIEDVKQFLAPLSRKSSRNSMHQEYQRSLSPTPPEGPKRKTSHSSLLDVINICKPSKPKQTPSYERRLIYQPTDESNISNNNVWTQEDEEVMGIHEQSGYLNQQQSGDTGYESNVHIPLRRKQIKTIESRQDRINLYNNAFFDCMQMQTDLVPWIIKQTQKGPPDAWFGYTPPEREPKKIMGIFKRKPKAGDSRTSLRAQQQQLGDELLNRSTPLLQHRYSNSNISTSPSNYTPESQREFSSSPGPIGYDDDEEEVEQEEDGEEYYDERYMSTSQYESSLHHQQQRRSTASSSLSPPTHGNAIDSYDESSRTKSPSGKPVSILKKSNSNVSMQREYQQYYDNNDDEVLNYDDYDDDEEEYYRYETERYQNLPPSVPQHRRRSSNAGEYYQQGVPMMHRERRYPTSPQGRGHPRMYDNDMMGTPQPMISPRRGRNNSSMGNSYYRSEYGNRDEEDDYYEDYSQHHQSRRSSIGKPPRHRQQQLYEEPLHNDKPYYNDSIVMSKKKTRRNSRQSHYYDEEPLHHDQAYNNRYHPEDVDDGYYQSAPPPPQASSSATRRRSRPTTPNTSSKTNHSQDYYGMSVKMTPFMMEEWEIALDDLCELYPRLDRHYINDFLRSAQGDFVAAKDMIMQMIMEIR